MREDPTIIRLNIAHYRRVLTLNPDNEKRLMVDRLLAESEVQLALATKSGLRLGLKSAW